MHYISDPYRKRWRLRFAVFITVMMAAAAGFLAVPVAAHAPTNITIGYNPMTFKLSVTITHLVDDTKIHYVRGVHVMVNGDVISDPDYKNQPTKNTFTYTYDVAAHPGDAVWVIATCVNGQNLETRYEIPKPIHPTTTEPALPPETPVPSRPSARPTTKTTHAAAGFLPILGAGAVMMILRE